MGCRILLDCNHQLTFRGVTFQVFVSQSMSSRSTVSKCGGPTNKAEDSTAVLKVQLSGTLVDASRGFLDELLVFSWTELSKGEDLESPRQSLRLNAGGPSRGWAVCVRRVSVAFPSDEGSALDKVREIG